MRTVQGECQGTLPNKAYTFKQLSMNKMNKARIERGRIKKKQGGDLAVVIKKRDK